MADKRISQFAPPTRMLEADDVFLINHRGSTSTVKYSTLVNSIMRQVSCCCEDTYGGFRVPRPKLSVQATSVEEIIKYTEDTLTKIKAATTLHSGKQQATIKQYIDSQYNSIKKHLDNTVNIKDKINIQDVKIPLNSNASGTRYVRSSLPTDEDGEVGDIWFQI